VTRSHFAVFIRLKRLEEKGAAEVIRERESPIIRIEVRSISPFARSGLEAAIAADPRFEIATEEDHEAKDLPDVILLDGLEFEITLLASISARAPTRFVLLSDRLKVTEFGQLAQLGVRAILNRDSSIQEIMATLEAANQGLIVISPEFIRELSPAENPRRGNLNDDLPEPLTEREREVLTLLAEGAGNKEIAARMGISENTAKFHVSSILGKLGATTRTEAVTRGYRLGLILI
jgi:DNA-binding NarL/FixJ family response regulator